MNSEHTVQDPGVDENRRATDEIIRAMAAEDPGELTGDMRLGADLGFDSLRLIEMAAVIEQQFRLPPVPMDRTIKVSTVKEVADLVAELRAEADA